MKRIAVIALLIAALLITMLARPGPEPAVNEDRRQIAEAVQHQRERDLEHPVRAPSPDGQAAAAPKHAVSQRQALLERIEKARTERIVAARGSDTAEPATPPLQLTDKTADKSEWNKRTLATLDRLFGECFALARSEEPDLAGTLTLQFTIAGEPQVGGLLEKVEVVAEKSSLAQPTLRECVQESLYALELDPPPVGVLAAREVSLRFP